MGVVGDSSRDAACGSDSPFKDIMGYSVCLLGKLIISLKVPF